MAESKDRTVLRMKKLNQIWRGEISLAWAYWGVGLLGLYPVFAFFSGLLNFGWTAAGFKAFPLPFRMFSLQTFGTPSLATLLVGLVVFNIFLVVPSKVIWRSANRSSTKFWRRSAKGHVVVSCIFVILGPPIAFFVIAGLYIQSALTPEFRENTPTLIAEAPALFIHHTNISIPKGAVIAHTVYYRLPVMDYEFGNHIILDASKINLKGWMDTALPFGEPIKRSKPDPGLEWNSEGLKCDEPERPESRITLPICNAVKSGATAWHIKKRIDLDHVVTLTIFPKEKLIWFYETSW